MIDDQPNFILLGDGNDGGPLLSESEKQRQADADAEHERYSNIFATYNTSRVFLRVHIDAL